jgi:mRNA-degrading endonuclease toxin of MazEF toxin-antitoxin module
MVFCLKGKITNMTMNTQILSKDVMKQGHLWVARVAVTEGPKKPRPVVIVGNDKVNDTLDIIVDFITKHSDRSEYDVELKYWKEAGLTQPSWVRTSKPITVEQQIIDTTMVMKAGVLRPKGYIGKLHDEDLANVLEMCKLIF